MTQNDPYERIPEYVDHLVQQAVVRSRCSIVTANGDFGDLGTYVRLAGEHETKHVIGFDTKGSEHRWHHVVHGATYIRRIYDQHPDNRYIISIDHPVRLPKIDERDMRRAEPHMSDDEISMYSAAIRLGVVRRITQIPTQIRIERELFNELPRHRARQANYLRKRVQEISKKWEHGGEQTTPHRPYKAMYSTMLAYIQMARSIAAVDIPDTVAKTVHWDTADELYNQLVAVQEEGHLGDCVVVDKWADHFGMRDWYEWKRLE